jgi:hypothetical protein
MRVKVIALAALTAAALAGCGGSSTMTATALQKEAESIQSVAAEGALVAADAADGKTTGPFLQVHGRVLRDDATGLTKQLAAAKPQSAAVREATALARSVHADLDALSRSGSDRTQQRRLERSLSRAATHAKRLAS